MRDQHSRLRPSSWRYHLYSGMCGWNRSGTGTDSPCGCAGIRYTCRPPCRTNRADPAWTGRRPQSVHWYARHAKKIPTVATLYQNWIDAPGKKPGNSTLVAYRTAFKRRIEPAIGDLEIDIVSLHDLERITADLTYDPAKDVKDLMSLLFKRAIGDGYIQVTPCSLLQLPEHTASKIPAWEPKEIESLWRAWGRGNRIAACCLLMIHSGMMPGELMKCKTDMIHWEEHTIIGCGMKRKERRENPIVFPPVIEPVLRDLRETTTSRNGFLLGMNKDKFYDEFRNMKTELNIRQEVTRIPVATPQQQSWSSWVCSPPSSQVC